MLNPTADGRPPDAPRPTPSDLTRLSGSKHYGLPIVPPSFDRRIGLRWTVIALSLSAAALYAASYFLPWWHITLFAPQYPKGLFLTISLSGISGDVREIDMLNHYIGMGHLEDAAFIERQIGGYAVGALGMVVLLLTLLSGKRLSPLMAVAGFLFPVGFLADSFYWLYRFGHNLDPRAPLRMKPFTPQLFGEGIIGQFRTEAMPELGFWIAVLGVGVLAVAVVLRRRVCASCARAGTCGAICRPLFVGPTAGLPDARHTEA